MSAANLNILIEAAATFRKTILYKGPTGVPIDLTGVTSVAGQVRPTATSVSDVPFTLTVQSPPSAGLILWEMSATLTATLTQTPQVYDIFINWSNGDVTKLLQGKVTVSPDVTRPA